MTPCVSPAQPAAPVRRPRPRREPLDHFPQELTYLNFPPGGANPILAIPGMRPTSVAEYVAQWIAQRDLARWTRISYESTMRTSLDRGGTRGTRGS